MSWSESENLKETAGYDLQFIIQQELQDVINKYYIELPVQDAIIKIHEEVIKIESKYNVKINLRPNLDF